MLLTKLSKEGVWQKKKKKTYSKWSYNDSMKLGHLNWCHAISWFLYISKGNGWLVGATKIFIPKNYWIFGRSPVCFQVIGLGYIWSLSVFSKQWQRKLFTNQFSIDLPFLFLYWITYASFWQWHHSNILLITTIKVTGALCMKSRSTRLTKVYEDLKGNER